MESRLEQLEKLLSHHLPGINIEEALRSSAPLHFNRASPSETLDYSKEKERLDDQPENEALPPAASGFDWRETAVDLNGLADGMASLSLDPSGKGYLGTFFHSCCYMLVKLMICLEQAQPPAL